MKSLRNFRELEFGFKGLCFLFIILEIFRIFKIWHILKDVILKLSGTSQDVLLVCKVPSMRPKEFLGRRLS